MPENNIVILRGHLASDPLLNTLPGGTSYLQLFLVVERGPSQMSPTTRGREVQQADVIRVVRYGLEAEENYFYLQKGATLVVFGWNQSRVYVERRGGRELRRVQLEVTAQLIFYGRGCNFERGDRHKADRNERSGRPGLVGEQAEPLSTLTEQLLKILTVEAE